MFNFKIIIGVVKIEYTIQTEDVPWYTGKYVIINNKDRLLSANYF